MYYLFRLQPQINDYSAPNPILHPLRGAMPQQEYNVSNLTLTGRIDNNFLNVDFTLIDFIRHPKRVIIKTLTIHMVSYRAIKAFSLHRINLTNPLVSINIINSIIIIINHSTIRHLYRRLEWPNLNSPRRLFRKSIST